MRVLDRIPPIIIILQLIIVLAILLGALATFQAPTSTQGGSRFPKTSCPLPEVMTTSEADKIVEMKDDELIEYTDLVLKMCANSSRLRVLALTAELGRRKERLAREIEEYLDRRAGGML